METATMAKKPAKADADGFMVRLPGKSAREDLEALKTLIEEERDGVHVGLGEAATMAVREALKRRQGKGR